MVKFYVVICKNKFYLYGDDRKPVYIDGEAFFEYETGKIREATGRLTNKIVDENNLSNANELKFFVIENSDAALNDSFTKAQDNRIAKRFTLAELLRKTISELAKNPKLYIEQFGINYDGECYHTEKSLLTKTEYSLLALSIEPNELLKFVD
ncbi:MAG: hypothetical protein IJQ82_08715 [Selenomonadaceae bacterium]|nr:hypothetical protein [Selenomonadaceae bacterium]